MYATQQLLHFDMNYLIYGCVHATEIIMKGL